MLTAHGRDQSGLLLPLLLLNSSRCSSDLSSTVRDPVSMCLCSAFLFGSQICSLFKTRRYCVFIPYLAIPNSPRKLADESGSFSLLISTRKVMDSVFPGCGKEISKGFFLLILTCLVWLPEFIENFPSPTGALVRLFGMFPVQVPFHVTESSSGVPKTQTLQTCLPQSHANPSLSLSQCPTRLASSSLSLPLVDCMGFFLCSVSKMQPLMSTHMDEIRA